jgi:hypothetical protein
MDVSNSINLGLFLLTAVLAWVAIIQGKEARSARDEARAEQILARESADRAVAAAELTANSLGRSADATEGIAGSGDRSALALERIARTRDTWTLTRERWDGHAWLLKNESSHTLHTSSIQTLRPEDQNLVLPEWGDLLKPIVWSPGESMILTFTGGGLTEPGHATVIVEYTIDGDERIERFKGRVS